MFVGDPYRDDAMGCYAPVMERAGAEILGDGYEVKNETGSGIDALCKKYVDRDMPVLLWITINLRPFIEGPSWRLTGSGKLFTWRSNEHCLLFVGYDDEHFYFNDPWENRGVVAVEKALARKRHAEQYEMAVGAAKARITKAKRLPKLHSEGVFCFRLFAVSDAAHVFVHQMPPDISIDERLDGRHALMMFAQQRVGVVVHAEVAHDPFALNVGITAVELDRGVREVLYRNAPAAVTRRGRPSLPPAISKDTRGRERTPRVHTTRRPEGLRPSC